MTLLDSLLAFALTLAALATVVTLILEILVRSLRLKTINQITLITKLVAEARPDDSAQADANATNAAAVQHVLKNPFVRLGHSRLGNLFATWQKAGAYYQDVSLEHTLRRLLESLEEKNRGVAEAAESLQAKAEVWARKYDEYRSALAAQFKTRAQRWSLIVGVVLAFAMNINGLRIFEVYLQDPELRAQVIETLQQEDTSAGDANTDSSEQQRSDERGTQTLTDPSKSDQQQTPGDAETANQDPASAGTAANAGADENDKSGNNAEQTDTNVQGKKPSAEEEALQKEIDELRAKIDQIDSLDLPVGQGFFPHCLLPWNSEARKASLDPLCIADDKKGQTDNEGQADESGQGGAWVGWLVSVLITGILIGLGAPFWYDVARRLAAVRAAFGGAKTAEARHRGDDAAGDPWARTQLIRRVVKDFMSPGPAKPAAPADGNGGAPNPGTT